MAVRFSVKADTRAMARDLSRVQRKIVPGVTSQALNRTAAKVKTLSVREIAAVKQIKQKPIRGRIRIRRASRRRLSAFITALLAGVRLADTGKARQTSSGVTVGHRSVAGAFIATMKSGRRGAFKRQVPGERRTRGRPSTSPPNLPIKEQTIALQPEAERIIGRHVTRTGGPFFRREFQRLLAVRLRRH